jgi:hypothetical protein
MIKLRLVDMTGKEKKRISGFLKGTENMFW